eukprot:RCo034574
MHALPYFIVLSLLLLGGASIGVGPTLLNLNATLDLNATFDLNTTAAPPPPGRLVLSRDAVAGVIIETRNHPLLLPVIRNVMRALPNGSLLQIFHGPHNAA